VPCVPFVRGLVRALAARASSSLRAPRRAARLVAGADVPPRSLPTTTLPEDAGHGKPLVCTEKPFLIRPYNGSLVGKRRSDASTYPRVASNKTDGRGERHGGRADGAEPVRRRARRAPRPTPRRWALEGWHDASS
jgi:hypothetical protein